MASHSRGLLEADPAPLLGAAHYYRTVGRPLLCGQTLEDAAVLLAARGDTRAARAALSEAIGHYQALGAEWDIRRASTRLRPYGIRRARGGYQAHPATGWQALTPTETTIAHQVARGLSNSEIATELFLSRNTVQTHVSHILAKLTARSRAEIAREALQHPPSQKHAPTA